MSSVGPSAVWGGNQIKAFCLCRSKAQRKNNLRNVLRTGIKAAVHNLASGFGAWQYAGVQCQRAGATSLRSDSQIQRRWRAASLPMKPRYLLLRHLDGVASSSEPASLDREEFGRNKATGITGVSKDSRRPRAKEVFWVCFQHPSPTAPFKLFS